MKSQFQKHVDISEVVELSGSTQKTSPINSIGSRNSWLDLEKKDNVSTLSNSTPSVSSRRRRRGESVMILGRENLVDENLKCSFQIIPPYQVNKSNLRNIAGRPPTPPPS